MQVSSVTFLGFSSERLWSVGGPTLGQSTALLKRSAAPLVGDLLTTGERQDAPRDSERINALEETLRHRAVSG